MVPRQVRRTRYAFFYIEDDPLGDLAGILKGECPTTGSARVVALPILTGERHRLDADAFRVLMSVPATRWAPTDDFDPECVRTLANMGLLLSDADDEQLAMLRQREEALFGNEWNLYAALYHYMTQWSGVENTDGDDAMSIKARSQEAARDLVADHGLPPPAFAEIESDRGVSLPGIERNGQLYRALTARRTTRAFDPRRAMTLTQLDTVLRYVFGCHGYAHNAARVVCIKRTSPSGGGLHPIEAYPVITNVADVQPGIYHYNVATHSLAMLSELDPTEGRRVATSFMGGQHYFGAAHVSFVLTARFYRNHWKYRRHQKAYAGILMDAAHLSQTLYLVSTQLGLGAFVTIAINGRDIEDRLGLDGVSEGAIAVTGCGPKGPGDSPLDLRFSSRQPDR